MVKKKIIVPDAIKYTLKLFFRRYISQQIKYI